MSQEEKSGSSKPHFLLEYASVLPFVAVAIGYIGFSSYQDKKPTAVSTVTASYSSPAPPTVSQTEPDVTITKSSPGWRESLPPYPQDHRPEDPPSPAPGYDPVTQKPVSEHAPSRKTLEDMSIEDRQERFSNTADKIVEYYNPHTDKHSTYTLSVDFDEDGKVIRINFPNGGWNDHIVSQVDNGNTIEVETEEGYIYTVYET